MAYFNPTKTCFELKLSLWTWQLPQSAMAEIAKQEAYLGRCDFERKQEAQSTGNINGAIYWQQSSDEHYRNARLLRCALIEETPEHRRYRDYIIAHEKEGQWHWSHLEAQAMPTL